MNWAKEKPLGEVSLRGFWKGRREGEGTHVEQHVATVSSPWVFTLVAYAVYPTGQRPGL